MVLTDRWRLLIALVLMIGFLLSLGSITPLASASPSLGIDTNDTIIDPKWGQPLYTKATNDPGIEDKGEIQYAWIQSAPNMLYFRVQTFSGPAVDVDYSATAYLDCDQDGSLDTHPVDRRIMYDPTADAVLLFDEDNFYMGSACTEDCETGERVAVPDDNNLEWMYDMSILGPEYISDTCRDKVNIVFKIVKTNFLIVQSETDPIINWDVPTVIELNRFQADTRAAFPTELIFIMGMTAVITAGMFLIKRK
jgi:hypothetical protein